MIRTFPTKQMQRLAADSCGPDSAAAANDTYFDMFRQLAEAAVLAERARPTLSGFKQNEKSIRKLCEVAVEKVGPRRLPALLRVTCPSLYLNSRSLDSHSFSPFVRSPLVQWPQP